MERRTFLSWLISGTVALPLRGLKLHAQAAALRAESLTTLRAVAPVLLPSELQTAGHDKVVNDFVQWLATYRSGAERSWGYGHPRKSGTTPIDPARYDAQLRELDDRARTRGGVLNTLSNDARRAIVVEAIEAASVRELPSLPNGQHVCTDMMSFFYTAPPALDLAYRAQIRRASCRGLAGAHARPNAIAGD
jgi:hypothetical protein